jgi:hypothetical protein
MKKLITLFFVLVFYINNNAQTASKIYYTTYDNTFCYVYSADLDGSNVTHFSFPVHNKLTAIAVDWNSSPQKLFIAINNSDASSSKIIRCNLDGTNQEDVITSISGQIEDIELDLSFRRYIYWTVNTYYDQYIYRGGMDGVISSPSEIVHVQHNGCSINGIALNVGDQMLWYTYKAGTYNNSFVIRRTLSSGAEYTVQNPSYNPHDIEYHNGKYYMTSSDGITRFDASSLTSSIIESSETDAEGIAVDGGNNKLYFIDSGSKVVKTCSISGGTVTTLSSTSSAYLLKRIDTDYNQSATPVELTSFSANLNDNKVYLNWQTATEVNNFGFEVQRASFRQGGTTPRQGGITPRQGGTTPRQGWEKIGFVEGHGNSNSPKEYSFLDENPPSGKIKYRLKQIDIDGGFEYSDVVEVNISVPNKFELFQNYPNPFGKATHSGNPITMIQYSIPVGDAKFLPTGRQVASPQIETSQRMVTLKVYDILGREVATLANQQQAPGNYSVKFDASKLSSGIYFYKLQSGSFVETKKMILLR